MDITQIALSVAALLVGLLMAISAPKDESKRWLRFFVIVLCFGILVSQIVILNRDSKDKEAQQQEFLKLKYSQTLKDSDIIQTVHSFTTAGGKASLSVNLSPTSGTAGEQVTTLWIRIPCPNNLTNKYKVIDPSNYGIQNVTPLYPVMSLADNQKYYMGLIVVPVKKYSPTDKLIVVTKHTNDLLEVESVEIGPHTFDVSGFRFNPINE